MVLSENSRSTPYIPSIDEITSLYGNVPELKKLGPKRGWHLLLGADDSLHFARSHDIKKNIGGIRKVAYVDEYQNDYFLLNSDYKNWIKRRQLHRKYLYNNYDSNFLWMIGVDAPQNEIYLKVRVTEGYKLDIRSFDNTRSPRSPLVHARYKDDTLTQVHLDHPIPHLKHGRWTQYSNQFPLTTIQFDGSSSIAPTYSAPWRGADRGDILVTSGMHGDNLLVTVDDSNSVIHVVGQNTLNKTNVRVTIPLTFDTNTLVSKMQGESWVDSSQYPTLDYKRS